MKRVYIATGLDNWKRHNQLRDMLLAHHIGLTYDWTPHGAIWAAERDRLREVAELEADGVITADLVVVLLPGGRGTHAEMGIAIGAGRPVLLVAERFAQVEATPETCAFYWHPHVTRCRTADLQVIALEIARVLGEAPKLEPTSHLVRSSGVAR